MEQARVVQLQGGREKTLLLLPLRRASGVQEVARWRQMAAPVVAPHAGAVSLQFGPWHWRGDLRAVFKTAQIPFRGQGRRDKREGGSTARQLGEGGRALLLPPPREWARIFFVSPGNYRPVGVVVSAGRDRPPVVFRDGWGKGTVVFFFFRFLGIEIYIQSMSKLTQFNSNQMSKDP